MTEQLWFFDTLVSIRIAAAAGTDGISLLEHRAPFGDSPPLHIHETEDEGFCLLSGELRLRTDGGERRLAAGSFLLAPKGSPHTYRVESREGARWLTVTTHGDFEGFVRALGRPALRAELPPPGPPPTPDAVAHVEALGARYGIRFVGPPLSGGSAP
jgi:quercetin dioxygenase-like cupin family protein